MTKQQRYQLAKELFSNPCKHPKTVIISKEKKGQLIFRRIICKECGGDV